MVVKVDHSGLGITIDPPPPANGTCDNNKHIHPTVTMGAGEYFRAHHHPSPDPYDHAEFEIYEWGGGGPLQVWRRRPDATIWEPVQLDENNRYVVIPPGWHHAGLAVGKELGVTFTAHTKTGHLNTGNTVRLPLNDNPGQLQIVLKAKGIAD